MFVSCSSLLDSQKQRELRYAALKSHTSRNAHQRHRRQTRSNKNRSQLALKGSESSSATSSLPLPGRSSLPAVLCGNSDPFDSQAAPVTALTNQLVEFCQVYHSRCWSPSFIPHITTSSIQWRLLIADTDSDTLPAARSLWVLFKLDQGTFWSAICSVVHYLRPLLSVEQHRELDKLSLQVKSVGLQCLRHSLAREGNLDPTMTLVYHVKALFREACASGDVEAARIHARSLNWLVSCMSTGGIDPSLLRVVLWSDAVSALSQLRRPAIEYLDWLPELRVQIWESAEPLLPGLQHVDTEELPQQILTTPLREAFLHLRNALQISRYLIVTSECWNDVQKKELLFLWMTTKAEYHISALLNLYFDCLQPTSVVSFDLNPGQRQTEAALTLALLHLLQKSFCAVTLDNGIDIHESARAVYRPLTQLVEEARQQCSESDRLSHDPAFLWLLYVGSSCEERLKLDRSYGYGSSHEPTTCSSDMDWFHKELAKQAALLHLDSWTDARAALSQFALNERLDPNVRVWYEESINNEVVKQVGGKT